MTRAELLADYDWNEQGIITSPGKFQGQMIYMPAAWDIYMNGFSDDEYDEHEVLVSTVEIDSTDWPEVKRDHRLAEGRWYLVRFYEDDQGFVREV